MKTIVLFATVAVLSLLPSCTLISGQKSAEFQPDPETIRAIGELARVIQATK